MSVKISSVTPMSGDTATGSAGTSTVTFVRDEPRYPAKLRCLVCGCKMATDPDCQPSQNCISIVNGGTIWRSTGNYGSSIYDTMGECEYLEAYVCDKCLIRHGRRVNRVEYKRKDPETTLFETFAQYYRNFKLLCKAGRKRQRDEKRNQKRLAELRVKHLGPATVIVLMLAMGGCDGGRGPNTEAPKNNLRRAIADPSYKAEPYGKKDPNDPPYLYPPSQPYHGKQNVTATPKMDGADAKTAEHYGN